MSGARSLSSDDTQEDLARAEEFGTALAPADAGDGQVRRRRRRHRTLGDKLRRNQKFTVARRIVAIIVLGAAVIAASVFFARRSDSYEPLPIVVPTAPAK